MRSVLPPRQKINGFVEDRIARRSGTGAIKLVDDPVHNGLILLGTDGN
jgi:hypothetical protein